MSNEKKPGCLGYLENIVHHDFRQLWLVSGVKLMEISSNLFARYILKGIILPSYMGIIISQYKDPYKPTSIMENRRVFFVSSWLNTNGWIPKNDARFEARDASSNLCIFGYHVSTWNAFCVLCFVGNFAPKTSNPVALEIGHLAFQVCLKKQHQT